MKSVWFAEKRRFWGCLGKFSTKRNVFSFAEKADFAAHARPTGKEKPFLSTQRHRFPTAPKLTCNSPFRIPLATVSLQYNNPFSKLRNLASNVLLSFRTDSNPNRRYPDRLQCSARPVTWWWPVVFAKITYRAEIWIVPGSPEGRNPLGYFWFFSYKRKE